MSNHCLGKKVLSLLTIVMLMTLIEGKSFSQENQNPNQKQQQNLQSLTVEQKALIKTILSKYNASTLTADQAKAIHEKFREAGIHGGPETGAAIIAAGFDPEKLRSLAPPPTNGRDGGQKSPTIEDRMKITEEKIIVPLSLNTTQKEKVRTAFKDFFTEMDKIKLNQSSPKERPDKTKVEPLEKSRDEKVKQVLSKEQFATYLELEKNSRPPKPS
jgi:hypothetical protein